MNWKFICILLIFNFSLNSFAQSDGDTTKNKAVGHPQKTLNPNTPFIYKKGFRDYAILTKEIVKKNNDTTELNELKFNAVLSAMYTKQLMYEKFGKWNREIRPNIDESHPILFWGKVKLFGDEDKLYSVYANGDENWNEIYASVLVFDENNNDCLSKTYSDKEKIIKYFSDGIRTLSDGKDFYKVYWQSVNNYNPDK
ncbi:hypothetical protein [Chryseobacterium taihuense]|uniref:GLPGLI family protein n=1 Tax=Chryseobacterium taihuense TaxID=1141221 RepID=A0ABY0QT78_9FLAO|nr:hypothetical protein [Chryseobacterium taihuense]SDL83244.1 hypothetical protein SAMN05216273_10726 [Chryseobacterium taihuense]